MELMERRRILLNTPHINIITGLQFVTDMVAPLESLVIDFSSIQDLHGYNSPWPAGGGKNLFDKTANDTNNGYISGKYVKSDGTTVTPGSGIEWNTSEYIPVLPNTQYTLSGLSTVSSSAPSIAEYNSNKEFITGRAYSNNPSITITTNASTNWVRISIQQDRIDIIQLEVGPTATSYAPYSNICPISGRTGLDVTITGKNLAPSESVLVKNNAYNDMIFSKSVFIPAGTYSASISNVANATNWRFAFKFFYTDGTNVLNAITQGVVTFSVQMGDSYNNNTACVQGNNGTTTSLYFTTTADTYVVFGIMFGDVSNSTTLNYQLEVGQTSSTYEPYRGTTYPISWQTEAGTVYGGTIDVTTGVLTVTHALYTFDGSSDEVWTHYTVTQGEMFRTRIPERKPGELTSINGTICNSYKVTGQSDRADGTVSGSSTLIDFINNDYSTTAAWTANLAEHPVNIVCELNTPSTYQLTPQQVLTLKGVNNLSMSGQVKFWTHRD